MFGEENHFMKYLYADDDNQKNLMDSFLGDR